MQHHFLHDAIQVLAPFTTAVIVLALVSTALGIASSRGRRLSAGNRHLLLSLALFVAPLAALIMTTPAGAALRALLLPMPKAVPAAVASVAISPAAARVLNGPSETACILFALWFAGALAFAIASVRDWVRWRRIASRATDVRDPALLSAFAAVWPEDARRGLPRLALSAAATEPMVVGIFDPTVLLPDRYATGLDPSELTTVFAHEMEHIRRGDNFTAVLHELIAALFWFDPLHWLARRRLLDLRERACDERVLDAGCSADAYITALAKSVHAAIESPAVACMSGFHVRERMESIMSYPSNRTRFFSQRIVRMFAAMGVTGLIAAFALLVSPPSFAVAPSDAYTLDVQLRTAPAGKLFVEATVIAPDGERVMVSKATTTAGVPVKLSSERGGRTYRVEVAPAGETAVATLEVFDGSAVVYRTTRDVKTEPVHTAGATGAEPISMNLKDADVKDVIRTFAQLSGRKVTLDPSVSGKVTINVTDVPWPVALQQAVAPLGLSVEVDGQEIRIAPAKERAKSLGLSMEPRRLDPSVKPPEVISRVNPVYPAEARAARISGIVIVETTIDETGVVREARVLEEPPSSGLGEAAATAVRQWVFAPALIDGKAVPVVFRLTVNFKLDKNAPEAEKK